VAKGKTIIYLTDDETAFLNVDVDVFAKYPLEPLAAALGDDVSLHYVGRVGRGLFQLHFALYSPKNADSAIRGLAKVIGSLPRSSRRLWNDASRRVFDLGFQGGFKPYSREFDITEEAVAAIAALGGTMKVTIRIAPAVEALGTKSATTKNVKSSSPENPPNKALQRTPAASLARRSRRRQAPSVRSS
jgi:hypothetical protein